MKLVCVVPSYNYIEGVYLISKWLNNNLNKVCDEYTVLIYDDGNFKSHLSIYNEISKFKFFKVIHSDINTGDLKKAFSLAVDIALAKKYDAILTIEHDCIPKLDTLIAMINVYKNFEIRSKLNISSVSAMYKWNNTYCYPVADHWFKDGDNEENGTFNLDSVGLVRRVGRPGVPFLFTLWNPSILALIKNESFPKMLRLDSEFGKFLFEKGYYSLRLLDYYTEHEQGGKKSWIKKDTNITNIKVNSIVSKSNTVIRPIINRLSKYESNPNPIIEKPIINEVKKVYINENIKNDNTLVNILTRTSNRPKYFKTCKDSIDNQTYKNINHLISVDDENSIYYVENYNYFRVNRLNIKPDTLLPGTYFAPYNLYLNTLLDNVDNGWIMFLDDDDKFIDNNSLFSIMKEIRDEDSLLFWKVQFANAIVPQPDYWLKRPVQNHMSMIGFMFHSKYKDKVRFDYYSAGDFRMANALWDLIPNKIWIDKVLTGLQRTDSYGGYGDRKDKK